MNTKTVTGQFSHQATPGLGNPGKHIQPYIHPFFDSWGTCSIPTRRFYLWLQPRICCWLADSFLGLCSSMQALELPKTVLAPGATLSLLPKEKQVLTSVGDRPREGRPWRRAAPATPHHHWQASMCTLHRKSLPSCCSLGHCSSLVVLFHIYSW